MVPSSCLGDEIGGDPRTASRQEPRAAVRTSRLAWWIKTVQASGRDPEAAKPYLDHLAGMVRGLRKRRNGSRVRPSRALLRPSPE